MTARTALLCSCLGVVLAIGGVVPADEKPKYVPSGAARDAKGDARPEDEVGQTYYVYADDSPDHQASGWMPGGGRLFSRLVARCPPSASARVGSTRYSVGTRTNTRR